MFKTPQKFKPQKKSDALVILVCLGGLTLITLLASAAMAAPQAPKARLELVGVSASTGQALMWDGEAEQYVLVRPGDPVQDFRVKRLLPDRVVLSQGEEQVLVAVAETLPVAPEEASKDTLSGG